MRSTLLLASVSFHAARAPATPVPTIITSYSGFIDGVLLLGRPLLFPRTVVPCAGWLGGMCWSVSVDHGPEEARVELVLRPSHRFSIRRGELGCVPDGDRLLDDRDQLRILDDLALDIRDEELVSVCVRRANNFGEGC